MKHIRRPLSAYAHCGAPAIDAPQGLPCPTCAAKRAAHKPQPPIMHPPNGSVRYCFDFTPAGAYAAVTGVRP